VSTVEGGQAVETVKEPGAVDSDERDVLALVRRWRAAEIAGDLEEMEAITVDNTSGPLRRTGSGQQQAGVAELVPQILTGDGGVVRPLGQVGAGH
jgi:hypothetical protein